jgi:hypothetical protein
MNENLPVVAMGVGLVVVLSIISAIRRSLRVEQIERSRREIAAYVAEGSMTPEQGERLLRAGTKRDRDDAD